jgi:hypothetical protein
LAGGGDLPARALRRGPPAADAGCRGSAEERLTLRSYLWPDEPDRLRRIGAALEVAARHPPPVAACAAERWLPPALAASRAGELTVVWQSVMRQYVPAGAWAAIERAVLDVGRAATPAAPLARLAMEQGDDPLARFVLTVTTWPGGTAHTGDHGPPVRWHTAHAA